MKSFLNHILLLALFLQTTSACRQESRSEAVAHTRIDSLSSRYYDSARRLIQGSEIEQHLLDKALKLNPENAQAWFEKAAWAIKAGNYNQYLEFMGKACIIDPHSYLGWRGAVKLYYLHDYDGAIKDLQDHQALTPQVVAHPRGENFFFLMGQARKQKLEFEEAIKLFSKYIESVKQERGKEWVDVYAYVYRGNAYMNTGNLSAAVADYENALELFPNCSEALFYKSLISFKTGKNKEGCACLMRSEKTSPYLRKDPYREVFDAVSINRINELMAKNCP